MQISGNIKWGIIGCGDVTEVKSGPAIYKTKHSELVAVMRRNSKLAADYAKRHNVPKWYSNANDLLNDSDVNAVYVATPPSTHKQYAIAAMKAGKPVYVEKPMALNTAECKEMIDVSEKTGMPLFVAYYRRRLPLFLKVKEIIDSKQIGEIRAVNLRFFNALNRTEINTEQLPWRLKPEISGGGFFFDLAPHAIDILQFLLGDIEEVCGSAQNQDGKYEAEDIVAARFTFPNRVLATGIWCFSSAETNNTDEIEITGTKGRIIFPVFEQQPIKLTVKNNTNEFYYERIKHIQQPLIQSIVDQLRGIGKSPSTGKTAIHTTTVMELMVKNYQENDS